MLCTDVETYGVMMLRSTSPKGGKIIPGGEDGHMFRLEVGLECALVVSLSLPFRMTILWAEG